MGEGGEPAYAPRDKFSPIRPPPLVKFMTTHNSDIQIQISDYSDILKEYVNKKPRALEFIIEGRILNLCAFCYLFKHRYFWT